MQNHYSQFDQVQKKHLTSLSDLALDQNTQSLIQNERELLTEILWHLREIDRRRLFSSFGFSSIYDYAVKRLGYSEDQAYRRITAMRLLKDLPEIESKIANGSLTLSNLSKAQSVFRAEKKCGLARTAVEKLEVLEKLEHVSKREAEKVLESESKLQPQLLEEAETSSEITLVISKELEARLKRLRDLKAHSHPNMHLTELIELMADLALEKWDPVEKAKRAEARAAKRAYARKSKQNEARSAKPGKDHEAKDERASSVEKATDVQSLELKKKTSEVAAQTTSYNITRPAPGKVDEKEMCSLDQDEKPAADMNVDCLKKQSRYIPSTIRHTVYMRDGGKCQICGSGTAIELDHLIPFSHGGSHSVENLRLLCQSCNQRHAIEKFGADRMGWYLSEPCGLYH